MAKTTARTVPHGLAPLLGLLELEQPRVVTRVLLAEWAWDAGVRWPVDVVVRRLRERGWLLDLSTRGVWEFAPAARAGAFGSGDPFIELRATLARSPEAPYVVAAESAAYAHGLASRPPGREVLGAPVGLRPPQALRGFRLVHWTPRRGCQTKDMLPTWPIATLLAFMAARPALYRDWPNVSEWLARAASATAVVDLVDELDGRARAAWARAAYLLNAGAQPERARGILARAPRGSGPYYLGPRDRPGRHMARFDVIDSTGMEFASAGLASSTGERKD
jgi:hypothetical protein